MRKTISPSVAIALIVIVLAVFGYLFYTKYLKEHKVIRTSAGMLDPKTGQIKRPAGGREVGERPARSQGTGRQRAR